MMDKDILKKAIIKGVPIGLLCALAVALVRMLIRGGGFTDHLFSVYGIASLICFPIAFAVSFYSNANNKKNKEQK